MIKWVSEALGGYIGLYAYKTGAQLDFPLRLII